MAGARVLEIETPHGPARVRWHPVVGARAVLLLGHGAGGGIDSPDLGAATEAALEERVAVGLVEQPYRVAGRRSPAPARQLDLAWLAVVAALRDREITAETPLLTGGRSSGARVACRTAGAAGAAGVVCLAFPLHPPGRSDDPTTSRLPELEAVAGPVLIVQGAGDPFGMPPAAPTRTVVTVAGTHSLRAKGPVRDAVAVWLAVWLAGRRA